MGTDSKCVAEAWTPQPNSVDTDLLELSCPVFDDVLDCQVDKPVGVKRLLRYKRGFFGAFYPTGDDRNGVTASRIRPIYRFNIQPEYRYEQNQKAHSGLTQKYPRDDNTRKISGSAESSTPFLRHRRRHR